MKFHSGNICRSPIAEAVFINELKKAGEESNWEIDSAAIEPWYVGRDPDQRAVATMHKHNLTYHNRTRIVIEPDDFKKYDYIFGMDDENIDKLHEICPEDATAKILLLGDFDPEGDRIIRDPYHVSGLTSSEKYRFFVLFFLFYNLFVQFLNRIVIWMVLKRHISNPFDVAMNFWHELRRIKSKMCYVITTTTKNHRH